MATKTISITEEAYGRLAAKKDEHESFSTAILRMTGKVKLSDFIGVLSAETAERMEQRIKKGREMSRRRMHGIRESLRQ